MLAGHTDAALSASVSPDGRTVATGSADGTIRLFDVATQKPVGAPLPAIPNRAVAPLFTPDGDYLLAITDAGAPARWPDARSRGPSGTMRCRDGRTRPRALCDFRVSVVSPEMTTAPTNDRAARRPTSHAEPECNLRQLRRGSQALAYTGVPARRGRERIRRRATTAPHAAAAA